MKEIKAWAVVDEDGEMRPWAGKYPIQDSPTLPVFMAEGQRVVRVTVRIEE